MYTSKSPRDKSPRDKNMPSILLEPSLETGGQSLTTLDAGNSLVDAFGQPIGGTVGGSPNQSIDMTGKSEADLERAKIEAEL